MAAKRNGLLLLAVALLTACASSGTVSVTATGVRPATRSQPQTSHSPEPAREPAAPEPAASDPSSSPAATALVDQSLAPSALQADGVLELQVGGVAGVPQDAAAVVLNVTATNTSAPGFLTVFPCGQPRPLASNVNYVANQSIPNLVIAKLGAGGKVCIYSMVTTDVVADVAGYFPAGSGYNPIPNPTRTLDTRNGTGAAAARLTSDGVAQLQVGGGAGVPQDAAAVVLNVTATNTSAPGFLTVFPCGQPRPLASNVNYAANQSIPNLVIAKLGAGGKVCIYSMVTTDVVADVAGYFPAGSGYNPIPNPTRILDTRDGTGTGTGGGGSGGGGGGTTSPGAPTGDCQFRVADAPVDVAFCDTFDAPAPGSTLRGGDLATVWGVSRISSDVNPGQGALNNWTTSHIEGCGPNTPTPPPSDVRVCNGRLFEAVNDGDMVVALAMYPKQPFDWTGRTGTVTFDLSDDSHGSHSAWPEFWITDKPYPAPQAEAGAGAQQNNMRDAIGFRLTDDKCNGQVGLAGVGEIYVVRNFVQELMPVTSKGCIQDSPGAGGALNHFEVRLNMNRIEVWATDPGQSNLHIIAAADNLNLSLSRGLIWIEDVHYTAEKDQYPVPQTEHTFAWDNVGFDGPKTYRDYSFDVPDAMVPWSSDRTSLGYVLNPSGSFNVNGVHSDQPPTGALVTFNWNQGGPIVPDVRVNGGPWHSTAWPFSNSEGTWRSIAVPVPLSEVHDGTNTIELQFPGQTVVSNINLILIAAGPVP